MPTIPSVADEGERVEDDLRGESGILLDEHRRWPVGLPSEGDSPGTTAVLEHRTYKSQNPGGIAHG
ncbi:hypothetical protein BJD99_00095 [Rhodococcus sp. 1163]|nr:hypothetical protein BJD99_00095 [Rhodococcus sp. 1163]